MALPRAALESLLRTRQLDRTLTTAAVPADPCDEYTFGATGVDTLDQTIQNAVDVASREGIHIVTADPRKSFGATPDNKQGHGTCSKQPWFNGLHLSVNHQDLKQSGAAPESFHPTARGHQAFEQLILSS